MKTSRSPIYAVETFLVYQNCISYYRCLPRSKFLHMNPPMDFSPLARSFNISQRPGFVEDNLKCYCTAPDIREGSNFLSGFYVLSRYCTNIKTASGTADVCRAQNCWIPIYGFLSASSFSQYLSRTNISLGPAQISINAPLCLCVRSKSLDLSIMLANSTSKYQK